MISTEPETEDNSISFLEPSVDLQTYKANEKVDEEINWIHNQTFKSDDDQELSRLMRNPNMPRIAMVNERANAHASLSAVATKQVKNVASVDIVSKLTGGVDISVNTNLSWFENPLFDDSQTDRTKQSSFVSDV